MFLVVSPNLQEFIFRLQLAICLLFYIWATLGWPLLSLSSFLYAIFSPTFWPLALLYSCWMFYDWNTPKHGSRPAKWARNLFAWKIVANYFPIKIIKTAEILSDRNYIFAAHPHGVLAMGSALMFGTNATKFSNLFPGIKVHVVTVPCNFWFPIRREFLMALGVITSDADSIGNVLKRPEPGNAIGIVPGGVAEMCITKSDAHKLILANRKGFVKLAIKYGASLVPIYNFGENNVFINLTNPKVGWIWRFQQYSRGKNGMCFPFFYGRSFLSAILSEKLMAKLPKFLYYGFLPFQTPIISIVGSPIHVEKCENPSQEQIDAVHAEYCANLEQLFEKYKHEFGGLGENDRLEFI